MQVTDVVKVDKSPFVGSILTVDNRRDFIKSQKDIFIKNQKEMFEARKQSILEMEGTEEEKQRDLLELEEKKLSEKDLERLGDDFARFQANKESKHYKAYREGKTHYRFHGRMFPVLTEEVILRAKEMNKILNVESNEQVSDPSGERTGDESVTVDSVHTGVEGRVSETV